MRARADRIAAASAPPAPAPAPAPERATKRRKPQPAASASPPPPRARGEGEGARVFVSNLSFETTWAGLKDHVGALLGGKRGIDHVEVLTKGGLADGRSVGCATVGFRRRCRGRGDRKDPRLDARSAARSGDRADDGR